MAHSDNHNNQKMELEDSDIPDLHISDRTELRRLNRRYGKERVVGWLQAKVALPTRLELKELEGENVDVVSYYEALADKYIDEDNK